MKLKLIFFIIFITLSGCSNNPTSPQLNIEQSPEKLTPEQEENEKSLVQENNNGISMNNINNDNSNPDPQPLPEPETKSEPVPDPQLEPNEDNNKDVNIKKN